MPADDRSDRSEHDDVFDEAPRSIFAATWFRALLILAVVVAVGAVSVPYIIDAVNPALKPRFASRPPAPSPAAVPPSAPAAVPPTASAPATVPPAGPAMVPAPAAPGVASAPATKTPDKSLVPSDRAVVSDKPASVATVPAETTARAEQKDERTAALTPAPRASVRRATAANPGRGDWWVQVGAYRNESTAKQVAARLREQNYTTVQQSVRGQAARAPKATAADAAAAPAASRSGADQYDVLVAGMSAEELNTRLSGKGLTAEESGNGAIVKPSLPLRDAVALSKELAVDGLKVQVRRAGAANEPAPRVADTPPAPATSEGDTLYRVRVGAFADRETAVATLKELEAKGYKPFITRGGS